MLLGCIADDFTGASDLANTLAKAGMATMQFVGVPEGPAPADCEAGVVALKSRTIPAAEAVAQSLAACEWLLAQGCRQILFKYCSTFDSTPEGNIGPVAEALIARLGAEVAVVCPVFPATGRTLYQGHLFVNGVLLNESGMQNHPLTPMTDPDIRRWLARQTKGEVGLVPFSVVRQGSAAIAGALAEEANAGRRLAVVDAVADDDLVAIGGAGMSAVARLLLDLVVVGVGVQLGRRAAGQLDRGAEVEGAGDDRLRSLLVDDPLVEVREDLPEAHAAEAQARDGDVSLAEERVLHSPIVGRPTLGRQALVVPGTSAASPVAGRCLTWRERTAGRRRSPSSPCEEAPGRGPSWASASRAARRRR